MNTASVIHNLSLAPLVWTALAALGGLGLVAIVSPARFRAASRGSSTWVDTSRLAVLLDKRFDIDQYVLPYSRALGVALLGAVGVLAFVFWCFLQQA